MMRKIAKFEKVSYEQFKRDLLSVEEFIARYENEEELDALVKEIYDNIKLPKRATKQSAGYDFYAPFNFFIPAGKDVLVPTGIRCKIEDGWVLTLYPRSGLGFKFKMQLNNTVGVIDADYYGASNEGHIMAKFFNDNRNLREISISQGTGMMQGIFLPFGITEDDDTSNTRTGGFGSTTSQK